MAKTSEQKIKRVYGHRDQLEILARGDLSHTHAVNYAFTWINTPQGSDYWGNLHSKYIKGKPLPEEALSYVRWLLRDDRLDPGEEE